MGVMEQRVKVTRKQKVWIALFSFPCMLAGVILG